MKIILVHCLMYSKQINVPIYGTKLTLGLVKSKLEEHRINYADLHIVKAKDTVKFGSLRVEFIKPATVLRIQ